MLAILPTAVSPTAALHQRGWPGPLPHTRWAETGSWSVGRPGGRPWARSPGTSGLWAPWEDWCGVTPTFGPNTWSVRGSLSSDSGCNSSELIYACASRWDESRSRKARSLPLLLREPQVRNTGRGSCTSKFGKMSTAEKLPTPSALFRTIWVGKIIHVAEDRGQKLLRTGRNSKGLSSRPGLFNLEWERSETNSEGTLLCSKKLPFSLPYW